MQIRYIKIIKQEVIGKVGITKEDLGHIKIGEADHLVDVQNRTYFDADHNTWKPITIKSL